MVKNQKSNMNGRFRFLSFILTLSILIGLIPAGTLPVFAVEATEHNHDEGVSVTCTCGTEDESIHATDCPAYVAPETAVCTCVEQCTEDNANVWCDVCGFDASACTGTDMAAAYADSLTVTIDTGESVTLNDTNGDSYYEIGTANELYAFAALVNGGKPSINGKLTANIIVNTDISDDNTDRRDWTPIGNDTYMYTGIFDGDNKTISGLYYSNSSTYGVGLFGYLGYVDGATVKNVGVVNSYFSGNEMVGGVVGATFKGTVENCFSSASVSGPSYIGGVVGRNQSTVRNCYNTGSVSCTGSSVGGVVGYNDGTVENCYNTGNVSGTSYRVGSVVGCIDSGTIKNCYYLEDCAKDGSNVTQFGIGAESKGSITTDVAGSTTGYEDFTTGEVAWLLNGKTSDGVWKQTLGDNGDATPNFTGSTVYYGYTSCLDEAMAYTNEVASKTKPHDWENGRCMNDCGYTHTPHTWSNGVCTECLLTCEHSAGWANGVCNECGAAHDPHSYENGFCTCGGYEPAGGDGFNTPFTIGNAGQLYWFANYVNTTYPGVDAVLIADITVNPGTFDTDGSYTPKESENVRDWTPIGTEICKYSGTFDGQGHTISGLYFSNESTDYVGLFGYVQDGTVKNVGVVDSYFCGQKYVGGVVGCCEASYSGSASVENCYNTGIVNGTSDNVGGVVGYLYAGSEGRRATATNCYNTGTVSGNYGVGGVVGSSTATDSGSSGVENCYNTGAVRGTGETNSTHIGGVVGENVGYYSGSASVKNCYNTGTVSGSWYVGGVAGRNYADNSGTATIENCYYLTGCATDRNSVTQFGIGASDGSTTEDVVSGKVTAAKDKDTFKSGAVAYLLNGDDAGTDAGVWKQTLDTDDFPNFTGKTVYQSGTGYTNHEHNWSYEGSGNQIQATCTAEGCTLTDKTVTITLLAPAGTYDGTTAYPVDISDNPPNVFTVPEDAITYTANDEGGELTNGLPVKAGSYTATLTLGEGTNQAIASVTYTIAECPHVFENGTCTKCNTVCTHDYNDNGICTVNGCYEPATLVTEENYAELKLDESFVGYYAIGNAGQLFWFSAEVNSGNNKINGTLTEDIDLENRPFTPIGGWFYESSEYFYGIFDGRGHKILNLYVNIERSNCDAGLFSRTGSLAQIRNVHVTGSVSGKGFGATVGGIVGELNNRATVENCSFSGSVYAYGVDSLESKAGGIAGSVDNLSSISNCMSSGTVYATLSSERGGKAEAGGIAGSLGNGTISNSYSTAVPTAEMEGEYPSTEIGGISGTNSGTISNCYTDQETLFGYGYGTATNSATKTAEQFASGEVTYLLNSGVTDGTQVWYQTIDTDTYPKFTGDTVYAACEHAKVFTNTAPEGTTTYENGRCTVCGTYSPIQQNANGVYEIFSPEQLVEFAQIVNGTHATIAQNKGANAILMADIDMTGITWTPICSTALYYSADPAADGDWGYTGTFDGNNFIIKNLSITGSSTGDYSFGLFGTLSGTVKNLGMENFTYTGAGKDSRVGSIAGQILTGGSVTNCYVYKANINTQVNTTNGVAGGIAGANYGGTIQNCFTGELTIKAGRAGGIVGDNRGDSSTTDRPGTLANCYTTYSSLMSYSNGSETGRASVGFYLKEVVYLLNNSSSEGVWKIKDGVPALTGDTVYQNTCGGDIFYSTTQGNHSAHSLGSDFRCTLCGNYDAPALVDGVYQIASPSNLFWFAQRASYWEQSISAVLTKNIDLNNVEWTPIGNDSRHYSGTFDGQGYSIKNLSMNITTGGNYGLFHTISSATVKNFSISGNVTTNLTAQSTFNYGSVAGYAYCSTIENVHSSVNFTSKDSIYKNTVAGIAGHVEGDYYNSTWYYSYLTNCSFSGTIDFGTMDVDCAGGIVGYVGYNDAVYFRNCLFDGVIHSDHTGADQIGGIMGYNRGQNVRFYNCLSVGKIDLVNTAFAGMIAGRYIVTADGVFTNNKVSNNYFNGTLPAFSNSTDSTISYYSQDIVDWTQYSEACVKTATEAQLASGEIAWLLNGSTADGVWKQTLGVHDHPVFDGATVNFDGTTYTNSGDYVSVTITWTEMSFTYVHGAWDPTTHTFGEGTWTPKDGGGKITVTNNASAVYVSLSFAGSVDGVSGSFDKTSDALLKDASATYSLTLTGQPSGDGFTDQPLGTVSVKLSLNPDTSGWKVGDKVTYIAKDGNVYSAVVAEKTDEKVVLLGDEVYTKANGPKNNAGVLAYIEPVGARYPTKGEAVYSLYEDRMTSYLQGSTTYTYHGFPCYSDGTMKDTALGSKYAAGKLVIRFRRSGDNMGNCTTDGYGWWNKDNRTITHYYSYIWDVPLSD